MTNLDSMSKSRDITLSTKVCLVKAMVFPVVLYGCESCTVKKAEHWRVDAFELWCWRRLLRVPWTARRSNQSTIKEISPGCSLEGLMLKLKLQYFGHLMQRADSFEKTLMLGKIDEKGTTEDEMVGWRHRLNGHEFGWTLGVGDGQGGLTCCYQGVTKSQTWLSYWNELNMNPICMLTWLLLFLVAALEFLELWDFFVELITISYSNHIRNSVEVCLFIWLKCHDIYY